MTDSSSPNPGGTPQPGTPQGGTPQPVTPQPGTPQAGIADALGQLSEETRLLVRDEIRRAQEEVVHKVRDAAPAALLLGAAAGLGLAAAASGYRFVLRILERATSPAFGALLATGGFAAGALGAARAGRAALQRVDLPLPTESLRDAGTAVKEAATQVA